MALINSQTGFYTNRIGTTDSGTPVFLYFDPAMNEFRPVIVPEVGAPYFASSNESIRRDADRIPALSSAVVGGAIGAILGGGAGAAIGAAIGAAVSQMTGTHASRKAA
jgi:hypothetical protein